MKVMGDEANVKDDQKTRVTSVKQVIESSQVGENCLVVIYGKNLGKKYELLQDVITIGRDPENLIVLDVDSVSRKHARIERFNNERFLIDLKSTNGTYLNDKLVVRERLRTGDIIKIGATILKYLSGNNVELAYHEEIYRMTITDGLTEIANKRYLLDFLEREMSRARRYNRFFSILMMDIDHFKKINDLYGHLTGDFILKRVAQIIKGRIRKEEIFARYGGEEFVIVMPESDLAHAIEFANILRELIQNSEFEFESQKFKVTVSIGVAQFKSWEHQCVEALIKEADANLYIAKERGRNCVYG